MSDLAASGGEKSPFRGRLSFLRGRKWPQVDPDNKKTLFLSGFFECMAEREGFEPSYGVTHNTISNRAPSATRTPLRTITECPSPGPLEYQGRRGRMANPRWLAQVRSSE